MLEIVIISDVSSVFRGILKWNVANTSTNSNRPIVQFGIRCVLLLVSSDRLLHLQLRLQQAPPIVTLLHYNTTYRSHQTERSDAVPPSRCSLSRGADLGYSYQR